MRVLILAGLLGLAAVSLFVGWLALPAAVGCFWGWLTLPPQLQAAERRRHSWLLLAGGVVACLGLLRFIQHQAITGIVNAGEEAMQRAAVNRLREIVALQDSLRRRAYLDVDADDVGSAALLQELAGWVPPRAPFPAGHGALKYPGASRVETPEGPALAWGAYLFMVCLPTTDGAYSARTGAPFDVEAAERHYVAYAWPSLNLGDGTFLIDEHEMIYVWQGQGNTSYVGAAHPPPCEAFRVATNWRAWKGKRPRESLPGATP